MRIQVKLLENHGGVFPVDGSPVLLVRTSPSIRMRPDVGSSRQFIQRIKVLLPEPEGPMMTSFSLL